VEDRNPRAWPAIRSCRGNNRHQQQQTTQGLGQQQSSSNTNNNESIPNHWDTLQTLNAQVVALMQSLVAEDATTTEERIDYNRLATVPSSEWPDDAGGTLKALVGGFFKSIEIH
jgi:hypothetical protein